MSSKVLRLLCCLALTFRATEAQTEHYVGSQVCSSCHRAIADSQALTAMSQTWRGSGLALVESKFDEGDKDTVASAQLHYDIRRDRDHALFSLANGASPPLTLPVQDFIGGKRHGISLLLTIEQLDGISIERPAMIEARYALLPAGPLILSPGFPKNQPQDLEHQLGRVLTPTFETRCLTCHGKPGTLGAGITGGVHCESCHGPGSAHVQSAQGASVDRPIVKPKSLAGKASMDVCAQCHSGFKPRAHSDPVPEDLLISSQIPALRHSECFIQSGELLTCTSCHNSHQDSAAVSQFSIGVCLRCHSLSAPQPHAAICPVNRTQGCIGCHMRTVQVDSFRVTDHWIRVQPDPASEHDKHDPALRSQVIPKREFLRLIAVATDEDLKAVTDRLANGESFGSVAHALSIDPSAPAGGFIGDVALAEMNPALASVAALLQEDSNSSAIRVGNTRVILHRQSRDFKWSANRLFHEALSLNEQGDRALAFKKAKQALDTYPYQLSGLNLMGVMLRQAGNLTRASAVLGFAAQTYPQDAATLFNLALVQDSPNQIDQLRHVIELDPDVLPAYQKLGALLYESGQRAAALDVIRAGLKIDPLSAALYYDLGLFLKEQGDSMGAARALALAARIDPKIAAKLAR